MFGLASVLALLLYWISFSWGSANISCLRVPPGMSFDDVPIYTQRFLELCSGVETCSVGNDVEAHFSIKVLIARALSAGTPPVVVVNSLRTERFIDGGESVCRYLA
jgi:hypothetical protein